MSIMVIEGFNKQDIKNELKDAGDCPLVLFTILNFVFSIVVQHLMHQLDSKFSSKRGRPAYPRALLLGVILYSFSCNVNSYKDMEKLCNRDRFIRIFTCGHAPKRKTFKNFFDNSDKSVIQKVFISTLVNLNDLNAFSFTKMFLDGTDVLVHGSRYYQISRKQYKTLLILHDWNLIHDGSDEGIKQTRADLNKKLEEYENDEKMCEYIKTALRNVKLFNNRVYAKIDVIGEEFESRNVNSLSITFPQAVLLPSKRGIHDIGFNLQQVMTPNNIVLCGALIPEANDGKTIRTIIPIIKKTRDLMIELQLEFGLKKEDKVIYKMFFNAVLVADAGYFTVRNLYYIYTNKINALIMPLKEATKNNEKLRETNDIVKEKKKTFKSKFIRVLNGYTCPNGNLMKLFNIKKINHTKKNVDNIHFAERKMRYIYKSTKSCKNCPYQDKCNGQFEDRISPLLHAMTDKFLDLRHQIHYKFRLACGEGINGFHKGHDGIIKFIGTTPDAIENELFLRDTYYNMKREVNIKGTAS